jgi:hypothetical protein
LFFQLFLRRFLATEGRNDTGMGKLIQEWQHLEILEEIEEGTEPINLFSLFTLKLIF